MTRPSLRSWQRRVLEYGRPHVRSVAGLMALACVSMGINLLKPWPLKIVVDFILTGQPLPPALRWFRALPGAGSPGVAIWWLALGTIIVFLASWLAGVTSRYIQIGVGGRMTYALAAEAYFHLQRLSLRFHMRRPTGDLVKRVVVDSRCAQELMLDVWLPAATAIVTLGMMSTLIWNTDRSLALIALGTVPVIGIFLRLYIGPLTSTDTEIAAAEGQVMATAEQVLTGLPAIQAYGREALEVDRFDRAIRRIGNSQVRKVAVGLQLKSLVGGTRAFGSALVMVIGAGRVLDHHLALGDLLLLLSYVAFLYSPLETLAYLSMSYTSAAARARRVFELVDSEDRIEEPDNAPAMPPVAKGTGVEIRFDNVSFAYEAGRPVLQTLNLSMQPGTTTALVGPTGAGKTTIASLILRLFDPQDGAVLFDGTDVRRYRVSSLRQNVSIVLQDSFLLPVSVADNIAYGRPAARREEVIAAARAANAHDFIERLPQQYDTVIGEQGLTLSGGERQRLAIARAFLKDAPILILDEPTSALDLHAEEAVIGAVRRLMRGRTTIIIAHRLSTVQHADQIVVLNAGRVVERGAHEDLLEIRGMYHRLYSMHTGVSALESAS